MSFSTWSAKDNPLNTLRKFVTKSRQRQANSRDADDAVTAINKVAVENEFLSDENRTLKRKNEQLESRAERAEREALGMREQGPQAAKDEVVAQLYAENERLRAACSSVAAQDASPRALQEVKCDVLQDTGDPFLALMGAYLQGHGQTATTPNNRLLPDNDRQAWNGDRSRETDISNKSQLETVQGVPTPRCTRDCSQTVRDDHTVHIRRLLKRSHTVHEASPNLQHHRQPTDESDQLMERAGQTAQRRRSTGGYRRHYSPPSMGPYRRRSFTDSPGLDGLPVKHEECKVRTRKQLKRSHTVHEASPSLQYHRQPTSTDESDQLVQSAGQTAQRRRSTSGYLRRVSAPSTGPYRRGSFTDSPGLPVTCEEAQQVCAAGVAAQGRRSRSGSRRCSSASSVGLSRRHSRRESVGLEKLMSLLNDSTNDGHTMSRLSCLVLGMLSSEGRPLEVATLRQLLSDATTRARTDCFLRYTVVNYLVTQLQSRNSARVFGDIRPLILESGTHFVEMMKDQYPVTRQRCSCPPSVYSI